MLATLLTRCRLPRGAGVLPDLQDHLSDVLARFHELVGRRGIVQRQDPVDDRRDIAGLDQRPDEALRGGHDGGLLR